MPAANHQAAGSNASPGSPSPVPPETQRGNSFYTFVGKHERMLPAYKTEWEETMERMAAVAAAQGVNPADADIFSRTRASSAASLYITKPPTKKSFRTPAEYEASQAYLLNWRAGYTGPKWAKLFADIIQGAWGEVPVIMMRSSTKQQHTHNFHKRLH